MIVAAWLRWKERHNPWWFVLAALIVVLDLLIGPALIAWEIQVMRGML